jgi:hypothetical protein
MLAKMRKAGQTFRMSIQRRQILVTCPLSKRIKIAEQNLNNRRILGTWTVENVSSGVHFFLLSGKFIEQCIYTATMKWVRNFQSKHRFMADIKTILFICLFITYMHMYFRF